MKKHSKVEKFLKMKVQKIVWIVEQKIPYKKWRMSDLMDMSKSIEDVGYRDISPISSPDVPHCTIVMIGSNVLSTEGTHFVQRSFWP